jgi:hypothetical protein
LHAFVAPAKAGAQEQPLWYSALDPRFRGDDEMSVIRSIQTTRSREGDGFKQPSDRSFLAQRVDIAPTHAEPLAKHLGRMLAQ